MATRRPRPSVDQPGLFDEPDLEQVERPKGVVAGTGQVKYSDCNLVNAKCEDCAQLVYQQLREVGSSGHAIRRATRKRLQNGKETLLCTEHVTARLELENLGSRKRA